MGTCLAYRLGWSENGLFSKSISLFDIPTIQQQIKRMRLIGAEAAAVPAHQNNSPN